MTTINVCSGVALNNSYAHTIYFDNAYAQRNYFASKTVRSYEDYSFCRRNHDIKVNESILYAQHWNYLYLTNPDGKVYYYFITSADYKGDNTTILHLEMDVIQTFMFDWELKPSFIERMTPKTDKIGENTIDEGLELGEPILNYINDTSTMDDYAVLILSTKDLTHYKVEDGKYTFDDSKGGTINDISSPIGLYQYVFAEEDLFDTIMYPLAKAGATDSILSMWLYPRNLIEHVEPKTYTSPQHGTLGVYEVKAIKDSPFELRIPTTLCEGYENPKNKKLFTYPYNCLHIYNNMGEGADLAFERFDNSDPTDWVPSCHFNLQGSASPDAGVRLVPLNYNGLVDNYENSLTVTGFPTIAWTGDAYLIWLAQNQSQLKFNMGQSVVSSVAGAGMMVAGVASGNLAIAGSGAVTAYSGVSSIAQTLAQKNDMKTIPDHARGSQSASVNAYNKTLTFTVSQKTITPERARIVDDYFTMYGYKQLIVDTPSIHNRTRFTYIKTRGCYVVGAVGNEDRAKIASIFDNGVTFWTNGDSIGDYDTENGFLEV